MKRLLLLFALFVSAFAARAQFPISLSGYPLVTTGWTTGAGGTGAAPTVVDSEINITNSVEGEANYVYYNTAVNMTGQCLVDIEFDFKIVSSTGTPTADGFAFWFLSNPPSSVTPGNAIGLPNYANGLILLFDTYDNNSTPDNPIETLLGYNGSIYQYVEDATAGQLCSNLNNQNYVTDGSWHHVKITYSSGNIAVYYNYSATASQIGYYPLAFSGYFGFSGSTGLYYSKQEIKNVQITNPANTAPTVTSPVNYCIGATATPLTATGTTTLEWFTSDTATVTPLPGAPTPSTATAGTTTYYVRQGSGTCISPPDSIKVVVGPLPAPPTITGPTFYCQDSTFVPFTTTGTGVLWYATPTGTGSATAPTVTTTTAGTYTYYATQTVSGCTSLKDSVTVTVQATPATPTMTAGDLTYCQYYTFVPFAVTGTNVMWYTGSPTGTGSATAPTVNTAVAGTTDYYVTESILGCPSLPLHLPVIVNAKPAPPVLTSSTYCQFVPAIPVAATGTNIVWYGPGVTAGYTTAPTPVTSSPVLDNYYATQTVLGCVSDSAMATVTVIAKPSAPITADTTYCQYTAAPALTATGSNLSWYTTATGGTALGAAPIPPTNVPGETTWYVTQTVNGCESDRTPLTVTTIFQPIFTITPSASFVCQYDSLTLTYTGPGLISDFTWALPAGAAFANGSTASGSAAMIKFDVPGNAYVTLTAGGPGGICSTTDTIIIKVVPQPTAQAFTKENVCLGDTVALALQSQSSNASSFNWTIDNTPIDNSTALNIIVESSTSGGPIKISWTATGTHIINVQTFSAEGCASVVSADTIDVHAYPNSSFGFKSPNGNLCIEDSVLFVANDSNYNDIYTWGPAHFFEVNNSHNIWGKVEEAHSVVTLTVTDPFGCTSMDSVEITPGTCCTVVFPEAFSPNGDTHNDVFRPISAGYHNFHNLRIVNRWGQTVFESTNSKMDWDGTYGGVPQDIGVYYYYIKFDCGGDTIEQKGDVTLVR